MVIDPKSRDEKVPLLIEWRRDFESGLDENDIEHARLLDRINALYSKVGKSSNEDAARQIVNEIYREIATHFGYEEKAMRERHYEHYADHKADHEALLGELRDVMASLGSDVSYDYERALMARLVEWFARHFREQDTPMQRIIGAHSHRNP